MKKLSREEFESRVIAIGRARKIFCPLTGGNISKAFQAYQDILAKEERAVMLSTKVFGNKPFMYMNGQSRPKCPVCGSNMLFRVLPENKEGIKVQLVCGSKACDTVLNSTESLEWWQDQLKVQNESEGTDSKVTEDKQEG